MLFVFEKIWFYRKPFKQFVRGVLGCRLYKILRAVLFHAFFGDLKQYWVTPLNTAHDSTRNGVTMVNVIL